MKNLVFLLFSLFLVNKVCAQQLNVKNGDVFTIDAHTKTTGAGTGNRDEQYSFQFKLISSDKAEYKLQCILQKAKINFDFPTTSIKLNTDSIRQTKFNYSGLVNPLIILQKPFTVVINSKGKLLRIEGYDELTQKAILNWHLTGYTLDWLNNKANDAPLTILKRMFFEQPEKEIGYQSAWTKDSVNYQVVSIRGALLDIISGNNDKTIQGKYTINQANGLLEDALITSKQNTKLGAPQNTYDQTLGKNTTVVADTAWINMAMLMSFNSNAFKNQKNDSDSARVYGYLKAHDQLFKNDRYYLVNRLYLVQTVRTKNINQVYHELLGKTPNKFLEGQSSDLNNKMYDMLSVSVDSAYSVLRYFYKDKMFNNWIQYSYSQNFIKREPLETNEKWKATMRKRGLTEKDINDAIAKNKRSSDVSYQLLYRMHADKNPIIQQKINALYLWVTAMEQKNNSTQLLKTADQFTRMNDDYMKAGNGGRYGLLIYSVLTEAGKQKAADAVMKKTMDDLEKYTADTLYTGRYAMQNMLAHAYYLKYQEAKVIDSVKALQYLAKAAQYSPIKANEKAYDSFYDRDFLKSKESYREEYINKLFEHGASKEALDIFADHINSNMGKLEDMQHIYESRFPDKSFKEFVVSNVIANWQDAPNFVLKGIDGKEYKLADYKGKWLVADFWGTWCAPCREEMPELDKFNKEINDGKHAGITFLGIACHDETADVKKYLKENKYGITVAMGSEELTNSYKIMGYPTKVLIAPNGKMLATSYGADWSGILKKFSELYAAN